MSLPLPGLATRGLHADHPDRNSEQNYPLAPDLQLSTTYRRPHPDSVEAKQLQDLLSGHHDFANSPEKAVHVYSRYTSETRSRAEKVLTGMLDAHALTYASGLTASYAAVLHYAPSVIAIRKGYFGVHAGINIYQRSHPVKIIDLDDEYPELEITKRSHNAQTSQGTPQGGLLVWVESPLNPTGEVRDIEQYAKRAHAANGVIVVDSTFAPLQDVFGAGVDMVMHSATKYFGGHSDLLMGILATKDQAQWAQLFDDRSHIGSMPGNMESWLLLRSLRTLKVRWSQQSQTATELARWLQSLVPGTKEELSDDDQHIRQSSIIERVWHASFQPRQDTDPSKTPRLIEGKGFDPRHQMKAGWPATFAFRLSSRKYAELLPQETTYFAPATSLGGVESLLEHRLSADKSEDPGLVRISVGLEDLVDLQADLRASLLRLLQNAA